jgi:hypothetical protein
MLAVANIQSAGPVHRDSGRPVQGCVGGLAGIARERGGAIARNRSDGAVGIHLANAVVDVVRNKQVASRIQRQAFGIVQRGVGRRAAIARIPLGAAGHEGHQAVGSHPANPVVAGGEQVATAVHGHADGVAEAAVGRHRAVGGNPIGAVARHRGHRAAGIHLANAVVVIVRNEQVARLVYRHPARGTQGGIGCRPAVA